MGDNKDKLDIFYESIKDYKRLLLKDAIVLYKEYLEEKDEGKKMNIRNTIICGFLYKVYEYIKNHDFILLSSSSYDMDDIINSFIEIMINRIDDGILLKANSFGYIFDIDFHNDLFEKLTSKRIQIFEILGIDVDIFSQLFGSYCELKMRNENARLKDIFEKSLVPYFMGQFDKIYYIEVIFDEMIECMMRSGVDYLELTSDKLKRFAQIMLKNSLASELVNADNVVSYNFEDSILQTIFEREAIKIIDNKAGLNEINKDVLELYYKEGYSLEEISSLLNITSNQSRGNLAFAMVKMRKCNRLKRYIGASPLGV